MIYQIVYSKQAQNDARKLKKSKLKEKAERLIKLIRQDPFRIPPRFETLGGNLLGCYSRRINIQHRLVYEVFEDRKTVHVLRMWSHYGD